MFTTDRTYRLRSFTLSEKGFMTSKQIGSLGRALSSEFTNLVCKKSLLYIRPVDRLLRGVCFEGSSFDRSSFYATMFATPLCVPTEHLFSFQNAFDG